MSNHEYVFEFTLDLFVSFIFFFLLACNNNLSHSLGKHWLYAHTRKQPSIIPLTQKQIYKYKLVTIKMCLKKNALTKDHNSFLSSALFSFSSVCRNGLFGVLKNVTIYYYFIYTKICTCLYVANCIQ